MFHPPQTRKGDSEAIYSKTCVGIPFWKITFLSQENQSTCGWEDTLMRWGQKRFLNINLYASLGPLRVFSHLNYPRALILFRLPTEPSHRPLWVLHNTETLKEMFFCHFAFFGTNGASGFPLTNPRRQFTTRENCVAGFCCHKMRWLGLSHSSQTRKFCFKSVKMFPFN